MKRSILFLLMFYNLFPVLAQDGSANTTQYFDGIYVGMNAGSQYFLSGAFINQVDVLAQEQRFVLEFSAGARKQFLNDQLVLGIEVNYGLTDGDLTQTDASQALEILYKNNTQSGFGIMAGTTFGQQKKTLVYGFIRTVSRTFELSIQEQQQQYTQTDKESWPKFGLGVEHVIHKKLHANLTLGTMRINLDDKVKNEPVENNWDLTMGLVFQL